MSYWANQLSIKRNLRVWEITRSIPKRKSNIASLSLSYFYLWANRIPRSISSWINGNELPCAWKLYGSSLLQRIDISPVHTIFAVFPISPDDVQNNASMYQRPWTRKSLVQQPSEHQRPQKGNIPTISPKAKLIQIRRNRGWLKEEKQY